jgi:hypothetical protein
MLRLWKQGRIPSESAVTLRPNLLWPLIHPVLVAQIAPRAHLEYVENDIPPRIRRIRLTHDQEAGGSQCIRLIVENVAYRLDV